MEPPTNLDRWATVVATALEPCLVIDSQAVIVAVSAACCEMFGLDGPAMAVDRFLLSGVLQLVDFTAARVELTLGGSTRSAVARALVRAPRAWADPRPVPAGPGQTYTIDASRRRSWRDDPRRFADVLQPGLIPRFLTMLDLELLPDEYAVCKLPAGTGLPGGLDAGAGVVSVTWTPDEVSIICPAEQAPAGATSSGRGACFRVDGQSTSP
jgi:hypothetical protein